MPAALNRATFASSPGPNEPVARDPLPVPGGVLYELLHDESVRHAAQYFWAACLAK